MTFFLMRNRFQQTREDGGEPANVASKAKAAIASGAGTLMNSLFGPSKQQRSSSANRRKGSNSGSSSPQSRASSLGRNFPPKRISFDIEDEDFEASGSKQRKERLTDVQEDERRVSHKNQTRNQAQTDTGHGSRGRADDQSSGTTDPPDDLVDAEGENGEHASDHGSDTSGPDSGDDANVDDELVLFMRQFVENLFRNDYGVDQNDKDKFEACIRGEPGRLWYARFLNSQRVNHGNKLDAAVFKRVVQFTAMVLYECYQEEDYAPVKTLMNICFTYYKEGSQGHGRREFLYHYLRKQAIWHSLKFWHAAFFDCEMGLRARQAQREEWDSARQNDRHPNGRNGDNEGGGQDDFLYRTLGDFINNMRAFRVAKDSVLEFLRKHSNNLTEGQLQAMRNRIDEMYRS